MNAPNWIKSSHDPTKISLTIKGLAVFIPSIVALATFFGIDLSGETIGEIINQAAVVGSAAVTLWGIARKLWAPSTPASAIIALLSLSIFLTGCASAQKSAYRGVGTAVITVDAAMNAWGDYVKKFHPPVEDELKVEAAYNRYQSAAALAASAGAAIARGQAEQSTLDKAIAVANASLNDLIDLIRTFGVAVKP